MIFDLNVTSVSVDIQIVDDTGLPVTGLVAATFPTLTWSLAGPNADNAFPALSDLATITTAYSSGGVKERGNGVYRLDVPNGIFTTKGQVKIRGEATGKHVLIEKIEVQVPVDIVRTLGTTSTGAAGYIGIDWAHINAPTTAVDLSNTTIKNLDNNPPGTLTAAQIATGVWQDATAGDFTVAHSIGKSLFIDAAPGAAGGHFISGSNTGPLSVSAGVTFTNSAGDGFTCSSTGGNGNGMTLLGQGSGDGCHTQGGATGRGMHYLATGDHAMLIESNGDGIHILAGLVSGNAITCISNTAGHAIELDSASGDALLISATGTGHGINVSGSGAGKHGINATGSAAIGANAAGCGIAATGGAASTTGGGTAGQGFKVTGGAGAASGNGAAEGVTIIAGGTTTVSGANGMSVTGTGAGNGLDLESGSGATGDGLKCKSNATAGNGVEFVHNGSGVFDLNASTTNLLLAKGANITGLNDLAGGSIATAVWQDAVAGDFTVANSIGKSLFTGVAPGVTNGIAIVGSAMGLANGSITSATFAAGAITTASIAAGAFTTAVFGPGVLLLPTHTGTAQSGSASTIQFDNGASSLDGFYNGQQVDLTGGTGGGQAGFISSYVGATRTATMASNWAQAPDNTTTFQTVPIVSSSGAVVLAASQPNYAPAKAGDKMNLSDTLGAQSVAGIAAIVTALMTDTTIGDFATVGSPGFILSQLGGAFGVSGSVFTAATLANCLEAIYAETGIVASANLTNDAGAQLTQVNIRQAVSLFCSALVGLLSGVENNAPVFQAIGKSATPRISGTNNSNDDRTAVAVKVPT